MSPRRPRLSTWSRRITSMTLASSVRHVGNERDLPRTLDGRLQLALVHRTRARDPPWQHLAALADERPEELHVLVTDVVDLVRAERADLAAPEKGSPLTLLLVGVLRVALAAAAAPSLSECHGYASIPSKRSSSVSSASLGRP